MSEKPMAEWERRAFQERILAQTDGLRAIARLLRRIEIHQEIKWGSKKLEDDFYECILAAEKLSNPFEELT